MWALSLLEVLLGGSFWPEGEGLGGEGIIGDWEGLRTEFGQGFPFSEAFYPMDMLLGDSFGTFGVGFIGGYFFETGRT